MSNGLAKPSKPPRKRKTKMHPVVKWLRTAGIASGLFGFGALVLADIFWPGVICIYLSFAALAIDVWFEPEFRDKWIWKLSLWAVIAIAAGGFSWKIVFYDAPLPASAFMVDAEYPNGTEIAGITFRPEFTELDVDLSNPTDKVYEDLDIVLRPTDPVAAIAQKSSFSDVVIEDKNEMAIHLMDVKWDQSGSSSKAIPIVLLATDSGYRMRCSHFPAHSTIKVVVALADIKWNPKPQGDTRPLDQVVNDPDYIIRVKNDDFSSYWMGHKGADVYTPRPTSTDWLKVEGTYVAVHRKRTISQKVQIGGKINVRQPS
jgi:hypothetical protein